MVWATFRTSLAVLLTWTEGHLDVGTGYCPLQISPSLPVRLMTTVLMEISIISILWMIG